MGNVFSIAATRGSDADLSSKIEVINQTMANAGILNEDEEDKLQEQLEDEAHAKAKEEEMNEFRKQLSIKRIQRKEILARHRAEKEELEKTLQAERVSKVELYESNRKLRELLVINNIEIPENLQSSKANCELSEAVAHMNDEFEKLRELNNKLRRDLVESNSALQSANSDISELSFENKESIKQINALKEVVAVSKTMISLREEQLNALKNKLNEIERTLADRETNLLSTDLRKEYEKQLQKIRTLRGLYEERARLAEVIRQGLVRELDEQKRLYQAEINKSKNLSTQIEDLETKVDSLQETIDSKNNEISACQDETNELKAEMTAVNKLFSQVLLGYKTKNDLDKLANRLQENHGILIHMAERENGSEISSALPKLLLELVSQVDENEDSKPENQCNDTKEVEMTDFQNKKNTTPEEIVENLPKVWKVLMELLSHQSATEADSSEKVTTCYKSVETKSGPVLVPSVSQTYIRLKDLIIEKLGLIKEVNHMKQLNSHLESRLELQERRLCLVTTELSKTWHVVSRLRRHHHQLHTHEKILKYELQQKRKLLNELKEELEYCREKLEQAREKNIQSEKDWKTLRAEFSSRKTKSDSPSFNNSAESGYSDERPSDESFESNDESEYVAKPSVRCKKKFKKSFETILDSSADFNLAAEREDPASDLLDVADLPLDTQDGDSNQENISKSCENLVLGKKYKPCEETEDEVCEIAQDDSSAEELCIEINSNIIKGNNLSRELKSAVSSQTSIQQEKDMSPVSSYSDIANIQDHKIDSSNGWEKHQNENVNYVPDHETNKVNHSLLQTSLDSKVALSHQVLDKEMFDADSKGDSINEVKINARLDEQQMPKSTAENALSQVQDKSENSITDFKSILNNVRQQNERLCKKDEKLQRLERNCSELVQKLSKTLHSGKEISEQLSILHNKHKDCNTPDEAEDDNSTSDINDFEASGTAYDTAGPSTSNNIDHKARFAARDLRLKRLEEQTKSLVNKVNKTTSKGIKINYKLEELHNIYGSESSRAGTPSEDNEDKNMESEPNQENE